MVEGSAREKAGGIPFVAARQQVQDSRGYLRTVWYYRPLLLYASENDADHQS